MSIEYYYKKSFRLVELAWLAVAFTVVIVFFHQYIVFGMNPEELVLAALLIAVTMNICMMIIVGYSIIKDLTAPLAVTLFLTAFAGLGIPYLAKSEGFYLYQVNGIIFFLLIHYNATFAHWMKGRKEKNADDN